MRVNKKIISTMSVILLAASVAGNSIVPVKAAGGISVTKKLSIGQGSTKTISVKGKFIKSKSFKSTDKKIATVNKKGVVKAVSIGTCKVTVTIKYSKNKKSKKTFTKKFNTKITVTAKNATSSDTVTAKNAADSDNLKKLIQKQENAGAYVSEDLDSDEYTWSDDGRLTGINWSDNNLTSLDVSDFTALEYLYCDYNQLTKLDISNNTALKSLKCSSNRLTSLNISNNTALKYLYCYNNQLTSLNISNNTALESLDCSYNQLTSLDISNNTALESLYCYNNQLTSLDINNCRDLDELKIDTGVNVAGQNTSVEINFVDDNWIA